VRALVQRVASARVEIDEQIHAAIGAGLLVLVGIAVDDGEADIGWLTGKLVRLRIFDDETGVMNRSVVDSGGELLAVSQFTLYASIKKGNRPSWSRAAPPEIARPIFDRFVAQLERDLGRKVPTGIFGADMRVHLVNDGPVTIALDTRNPE
jgi:D-tyrosyl-tRNA(Tyr) deacylase